MADKNNRDNQQGAAQREARAAAEARSAARERARDAATRDNASPDKHEGDAPTVAAQAQEGRDRSIEVKEAREGEAAHADPFYSDLTNKDVPVEGGESAGPVNETTPGASPSGAALGEDQRPVEKVVGVDPPSLSDRVIQE